MRLIHGADFHVGLNRYSPAADPNLRLRDQLDSLDRFRQAAIDNTVELGIIAGDLFHQRNPSAAALAGVAAFARRWSEEVPAELVIVPGNHDGMTVVGDPETHTLGWLAAVQMPGIHVVTEPSALHLMRTQWARSSLDDPTPEPLAHATCFPYPHKRAFDQVRPDLTPEQRMDAIGAFVHEQITNARWATAASHEQAPRIFVGHLSVAGSSLGSERMMRFGWDVAVGADAFEGFDYAALGHIHVQQEVSPRAYYAGSPEYVDFGEAGQKKGFLLVDVERGKLPVVTPVDSQPRPMVVVTYDDVGATYNAPEGAIVLVIDRRGRLMVVNNAVHVAYRDLPVETVAVATDRALAADMDVESALKHWLAINGHDEEPALSAARDLLAQ